MPRNLVVANRNAGNPWGSGRCVGVPAWPVGWYGQTQRWGVGDSVRLLARGGHVHVAETFAFADVHTRTLHVNCTLSNSQPDAARVSLLSSAVPKPGQRLKLSMPPDGPALSALFGPGIRAPGEVTVPAHGSTTVHLSLDFTGGDLWWPERPALYDLRTTVLEAGSAGGAALDRQSTVIGFKQIEIAPSGESLLLNGRRLNLRGTSIHPSQDFQTTWGAQGLVATWPSAVQRWKSLGVNVLRVHQGPAPEAILEGCDEGGLMIIEESAVYARQYSFWSPTLDEYVENSIAWIDRWVRQRRNHPAIALWSAENENGVAFTVALNGERYSIMSDAQILRLATAVHALDPTRPVGCDGDQIGSAKHIPGAGEWIVTNYHYPEGYGKSWGATEDTIYLPLQTPGRLNAAGEFMTDYQSTPAEDGRGGDNKLWHGLVVRGLRYTGWADIRPYTLAWALSQPAGGRWAQAAECVRTGLSAVAVFDKEYDDLGPVPLLKSLPELSLSAAEPRRFVVFNDEFISAGSNITVGLALKSGSAQLGAMDVRMDVPPGEKIELNCALSHAGCGQADSSAARAGASTLELVLTAAKAGEEKFSETKTFSGSVGCSLLAGSVRIACKTVPADVNRLD
eukprot:COSAG04_NODE_4_length_52282_cov_12.667133_35_plen_623_part_00